MTKQDFELIAEVLRNAKSFGEGDSLVYSKEIVDDFALVLKATNPRFDAERFIAACEGRDSHDMAGRKVRYAGR